MKKRIGGKTNAIEEEKGQREEHSPMCVAG
jgi:hypothetical protein